MVHSGGSKNTTVEILLNYMYLITTTYITTLQYYTDFPVLSLCVHHFPAFFLTFVPMFIVLGFFCLLHVWIRLPSSH